ncbi:hypothetical protein, variant [Allomyces macrogynus ATCC 38327]|uniref:BRCT domain-containing protein n=1 Tax=Allomyces macrogynus (strain ATCC 38327) TaxID=578462 RepID=A0A0L0T5M8_ALLM3|nr:hypothetical protein, variant [Allomyces macrogynus ATCC 38327]|eukprot:KNE70098.1 hypothetical protein, variant [Allomyces macrogynus ATCC 38327]
MQAMDLGKPVASMFWLFDVIRTSDWVDPTASVLHFPFPPPPRKITYPTVQLCVTEFEGYERDYVKKMIELLGTKYSSTMSTETTHLVAARPKGTKFTAATGWPTVRIVNAEWLEDSLLHGALQDDTLPQYTHFRDPTELPRPVVGATRIPQSAIDRVVRVAREHEARVQERKQRALESLLDAQGYLAGEPVEERRAKEKVQASLRNQWQELRKLGRAEREAVVKTWELEDADFLMSDGEEGKGKGKVPPETFPTNGGPAPAGAADAAAARGDAMDADPAPTHAATPAPRRSKRSAQSSLPTDEDAARTPPSKKARPAKLAPEPSLTPTPASIAPARATRRQPRPDSAAPANGQAQSVTPIDGQGHPAALDPPVLRDPIAAPPVPPVLAPSRSVEVPVKSRKPAPATVPVEVATDQERHAYAAAAVPAPQDAMEVDEKVPEQERTLATRPSKQSAQVRVPMNDTLVPRDGMEVVECTRVGPEAATPAERRSKRSAQVNALADETAVATPPPKPSRRYKATHDPPATPTPATAAPAASANPTLPTAPEPKSEPRSIPPKLTASELANPPRSTAPEPVALTTEPAESVASKPASSVVPSLDPAPALRKPVEVHLATPALAAPQVLEPKPRATRSRKSATTTAPPVATTAAQAAVSDLGAVAVETTPIAAAEPAPTPTPAAPKRRSRNFAGTAAVDTIPDPPPAARPRRSASMVSTTSLSPAASSGTPNIAFTQVRPTVREQRVLERLGATVNPRSIDPPCTHLVTKDVTRTEKFLYAVLTARYIVEKGWVEKCVEVGHLVDEEPYLLTALTPSGKSVRDVMSLCRTHPPLRGYRVAVHPNVAAPPAVMSNDTFRRLALAAGAEEVLTYSRVSRYSTATRGPLLVFAAEMAPDLAALQSKPGVTLLLINALGQTILTADLASTMADAQLQLPPQKG